MGVLPPAPPPARGPGTWGFQRAQNRHDPSFGFDTPGPQGGGDTRGVRTLPALRGLHASLERRTTQHYPHHGDIWPLPSSCIILLDQINIQQPESRHINVKLFNKKQLVQEKHLNGN